MRFDHLLVRLSIPVLFIMALSSCRSSGSVPLSLRSRVSAALAEVSVNDGGVAGMVVPGMVAGFHRTDKPVVNVAYGFADNESLLPASESDLFHIGSLTKTFTAALIMQLDQENRLSIDDPITPRHVMFPNGENITIRMLLAHTSGIQSFTDFKLVPQFKALLEKNDNPPPREMIDLVINANSPDFAPGIKYKYSNSNYILLGIIAEKVTGNAWNQEVRSRFLTPLNLKNTYTYGKEIGPEAVTGYTICADDNCTRFAVTRAGAGLDWKASWSAGGIVSTAGDMATWIHALVAGDILDDAHRHAMQTLTPQSKTWAATLSSHYSMVKGVGLCLFQYSYPDVGEGWGHEGQINGYSNVGIYFAQAGFGVSLLTNLNQTDVATALGRVATTIKTSADLQ